jgi:hypothetical protein
MIQSQTMEAALLHVPPTLHLTMSLFKRFIPEGTLGYIGTKHLKKAMDRLEKAALNILEA